jgi:hypothetical protein
MWDTCTKCGSSKKLNKKSWCQPCSTEYERKRWGSLSEQKRREKWLKTKYSLPYSEYESMFNKQDGKCLSCQTEISIKAKENGRDTACVDHCHKTKKVRGLLCNHCNRALGLVKEDIQTLRNLIKYLEVNNV